MRGRRAPTEQDFEIQTKTLRFFFPEGNWESGAVLTEGRKWFLKMEFNEGCL